MDLSKNYIICGDCAVWLKDIPPESVDLCYIDPPFFTQRDFGDFTDKWKNGIAHYIGWMRPKIIETYRILKSTGSIMLHCDWHASHHLRLLLEEVFGEKNFVNEIIWCYDVGGRSSRRFGRKHDAILFFSKTKKYFFNVEGAKSLGKKKKTADYRLGKDENGRPYQDKIVKLTGKIYRYYLDENKIPEDWWSEINSIQSGDKERTGYKTQKPEALIKRIIKSTTNNDGLVLDFMGGSGTTAKAAADLGRQFITMDISGNGLQYNDRTAEKSWAYGLCLLARLVMR